MQNSISSKFDPIIQRNQALWIMKNTTNEIQSTWKSFSIVQKSFFFVQLLEYTVLVCSWIAQVYTSRKRESSIAIHHHRHMQRRLPPQQKSRYTSEGKISFILFSITNFQRLWTLRIFWKIFWLVSKKYTNTKGESPISKK